MEAKAEAHDEAGDQGEIDNETDVPVEVGDSGSPQLKKREAGGGFGDICNIVGPARIG